MALKISDLTKERSPQFTLGPLSLEIQGGETVALLGHNGAGKSTFFQLITGSAYPTTGSLVWDHQKIHPENPGSKKALGYLPQELVFPPWASARDLLGYNAALRGLPKDLVEEHLGIWGCEDFANKPLGQLSYGMEKRVGLIFALIHNPGLLILDEPFSGLDLIHTETLFDVLASRKTSGQTTILSTHVLPYGAQLGDRCLILKKGRMGSVDCWDGKGMEERIQAIKRELL